MPEQRWSRSREKAAGHRTAWAVRFGAGCLCSGLALVAASGAGCGPTSVRRYAASGEVTFGGRPVAQGSVSFDPVTANPEGRAESKPVGGGFAHIRDGRFDTAAGGRGHIGGPHRIIVVALPGGGNPPTEAVADDFRSPPQLFPPYEITLDLPRGTARLDLDVPPGEAYQPRQTKLPAVHGHAEPGD